MALEGELGILRPHPLSVVLHPYQLLAAELDGDGHARGSGVEGVLDELLYDGRRALDDLAGGNLVCQVERKTMDPGHGTELILAVREVNACGARHSQRRPRNIRIMLVETAAMMVRTHQN